MDLSLSDISTILDVPLVNVQRYWPPVDECMSSLCADAYNDNVRIAALATIRVETRTFAPVKEEGGAQYFIEHYWDNEHVRQMLGNLSPEDAVKYCGRGLAQITGRDNYARFGRLIGADLLSNPDQALDPNTAAALFAAFFHIEKGATQAASTRQWTELRKIWNGGRNGLELFLYYITQLNMRMPNAASASQ